MNRNFSLIMSIYSKIKVSDLIESLRSIGNQSFKPNDVVIVLDGYCTISQIYQLKKFLNLYFKDCYKIISNKKNMGIPYSYNKAIKLTKNNLVAICDSDDVSYFNRFKYQIKYLLKNRKVGLVGSYVHEYNIESNKLSVKKVPLTNRRIKFLSNFKNPINHPTVVFNKKILFKSLIYEKCERMEDYHLWIRAIKKNIIIRNIPLPLVKSKLNNSFYKRRSSYQILKSEYEIYKLLIKFRKAFFVILTLTFFLKIFYHLSPINIKPTLRKYINSFLN
jgi:glycosyltransferase involved in cell wall biosynthesis